MKTKAKTGPKCPRRPPPKTSEFVDDEFASDSPAGPSPNKGKNTKKKNAVKVAAKSPQKSPVKKTTKTPKRLGKCSPKSAAALTSSYADILIKYEMAQAQIAELTFKNEKIEEALANAISKEPENNLEKEKPQAANTTTAKGKKPTKAALEASLVDLAKEKDETEDKLVAKEVLLQQTLLKLKQATEAHNKEVDTLRLEADQEKVRRQEVAWTLQAMELAKKEFQALVAEFKQRKAGFEVEKKSQGSKLEALEKRLREQKEKNAKLEAKQTKDKEATDRQVKLHLEAKKAAEDKLKAQLDANKKLTLLNNLTRNKETKKIASEKEQMLEKKLKMSEDKAKRLENELLKVSDHQGRTERELINLKRENFQKETILGEIRVEMSNFEANWRNAEEERMSLKVDLDKRKIEAAEMINFTENLKKEKSALAEEKKSLLGEVHQLTDLQKKYKKLKETLQRYVDKHRQCREKHRSNSQDLDPQAHKDRRTISVDELVISRSPSSSITPPPPLAPGPQAGQVKSGNESQIIRNYKQPLSGLRAASVSLPQPKTEHEESVKESYDPKEASYDPEEDAYDPEDDAYDPEDAIQDGGGGGSSPYDPEEASLSMSGGIKPAVVADGVNAANTGKNEPKKPLTTPSIYINPKIYQTSQPIAEQQFKPSAGHPSNRQPQLAPQYPPSVSQIIIQKQQQLASTELGQKLPHGKKQDQQDVSAGHKGQQPAPAGQQQPVLSVPELVEKIASFAKNQQIPGVCLPATSGQATTIAGQSSSTNNLATQPRVGAACQSVGVHGDQGAAVDAASADLRAAAASPHTAAATHAVAASSQTAAGPQAARAASLSEQDILGARFREADGMLQAWIQRMEKEKKNVPNRPPSIEEEVQEVGPVGTAAVAGTSSRRRGTKANGGACGGIDEDAVVILSDTNTTRVSRDTKRSSKRKRRRSRSRSSSSYSSSSSSSSCSLRSRHKRKSRRSRRRHSSSKSRSRSRSKHKSKRSRHKRRKSHKSSRKRKTASASSPVYLGGNSATEDNDVITIDGQNKQARPIKSEKTAVGGHSSESATPGTAPIPTLRTAKTPTPVPSGGPNSGNAATPAKPGNSTTPTKSATSTTPTKTATSITPTKPGTATTPPKPGTVAIPPAPASHSLSDISLPPPSLIPPLPPKIGPPSTATALKGEAEVAGTRPSIQIKEELISLNSVQGSAFTVQWRDFCSTCGCKLVNSEHYDARGVCRKKLSWDRKGLKVVCKYCGDSSHWMEGCPLLSSFCFRCWCWGHTDGCHERHNEDYIATLLQSYTKSRLMFHPGVKEHSLPANTRNKEGWRYLGSRAELLIIAENLQPDGTYQPWLHPEWNKFF